MKSRGMKLHCILKFHLFFLLVIAFLVSHHSSAIAQNCGDTYKIISKLGPPNSNGFVPYWQAVYYCADGSLHHDFAIGGSPAGYFGAGVDHPPLGTMVDSDCEENDGDCAAIEVCGDGLDNDGKGGVDDGCGTRQMCRMKHGGPIDIANGIVQTIPLTDFYIQGANGDDIHLTRYYRSLHTVRDWGMPVFNFPQGRDTNIGHGWSHNLQTRLEFWSNGLMVDVTLYHRANGEVFRFSRPGECFFENSARNPQIQISCVGGTSTQGFIVNEGDNLFHQFDEHGHVVASWSRGGSSISYIYNQADGRLENVSNSSGQTVHFAYAFPGTGYVVERICLNDPDCQRTSPSVLSAYTYSYFNFLERPSLRVVRLSPNDADVDNVRRVTYGYQPDHTRAVGDCENYNCDPFGTCVEAPDLADLLNSVSLGVDDVPFEQFYYVFSKTCNPRASVSITPNTYHSIGVSRKLDPLTWQGPPSFSGAVSPVKVNISDLDNDTHSVYTYHEQDYLPVTKEGDCFCGSSNQELYWSRVNNIPGTEYIQMQREDDPAYGSVQTTFAHNSDTNMTHMVENDDDMDATNGSSQSNHRKTFYFYGDSNHPNLLTEYRSQSVLDNAVCHDGAIGSGATDGCQRLLLSYDTEGRPVTAQMFGATQYVTQPPGTFSVAQHQVNFSYDSEGRINSIEGPRFAGANALNRTEFEYYGGQQSVSIEKANRLFRIKHYPELQQSPLVTTVNDYDEYGNAIEVEDANGNSTFYEYNQHGQILSITSEGPNQTSIVRTLKYDSTGYLKGVTYPKGNRIEFVYEYVERRSIDWLDENGNPMLNPDGQLPPSQLTPLPAYRATKVRFYDSQNIIRFESLLTYNGNGQVELERVSRRSPLSLDLEVMNHVKSGQIIAQLNGNDVYQAFDYNTEGMLTAIRYVQNPGTELEISMLYDSLKRVTSIHRGFIQVGTPSQYGDVGFTRNIHDSIIAIRHSDANTNIEYNYVFDDFGNLVRFNLPGPAGTSRTFKYEYDETGSVITKVDPDQRTSTYVYDGLDRIVTENTPDGVITYTYDETQGGNNGKGRLTSISDLVGTTQFSWDELGRITSEERTIDGLSQALGGSLTVNYTYDANGNIESLEYPSGASVQYSYTGYHDDLPVEVTMKDAPSSTPKVIATNIEWLALGAELSKYTAGNGMEFEFEYNLNRAPKKVRSRDALNQLQYEQTAHDTYTDLRSNDGRIVTNEFGLLFISDYAYDQLDRLTQEQIEFNGAYLVKRDFEIDTHGNRIRVIDRLTDYSDEYYYEGQFNEESEGWDNQDLSKNSSRLLTVIDPPYSNKSVKGRESDLNEGLRGLISKAHNALSTSCNEGGNNFTKALSAAAKEFRQQYKLGGIEYRVLLLELPQFKAHLKAYASLNTRAEKLSYACKEIVNYLDALVNTHTLVKTTKAGGQPPREFKYDNAGNLIEEDFVCYTYDGNSRLTTVSIRTDLDDDCKDAFPAFSYYYDWRGRRTRKNILSIVDYYYIYGPNGSLLAEYADMGGAGPTREYIYLGGRQIAMVRAGDVSGDSLQNGGGGCPGGIGTCAVRPRSKANALRTGWLLFPILMLLGMLWRRACNKASKWTLSAVLGVAVIAALGTSIDCAQYSPDPSRPVFYIHSDLRHRPVWLTDEQGTLVWRASYDVFGDILPGHYNDDQDGDGETIDINSRGPGQYWDDELEALGQTRYYNYHRYYDPTLGRYNRVEPILAYQPVYFAGGTNNPYLYANHNPNTFHDYDALDSCGPGAIKCQIILAAANLTSATPLMVAVHMINRIAASGVGRAVARQGPRAMQACGRFKRSAGVAAQKIRAGAANTINRLRAVSPKTVSPSSRALGRSLENAGYTRPAQSAAHHIVAGLAKRAENARKILQKFGVGVNEAANGVFLPTNQASQNLSRTAVHSGVHTSKYYRAVNEALKNATTRQQVLDILGDIRQSLMSGGFPL